MKACVNNLSKGKKQRHGNKKKTAKYTAQKLYDKKVLVSIDDVHQSTFRAVTIEFSSTDEVGVFEVSGKLGGLNLEKINLIFEDLLQVNHLPF